MRQITCVLAAAGLILVALPSSAAPPRNRTVEAPYKTPAPGAYTPAARAWYYDCEAGIGCALLRVEKGDRKVRLEVRDISGGPVHAEVFTMPGGNHYFDFCGKTEERVPVTAGMELLVHVVAGTCPDGSTASTPTNGLVKATFSRR